MISVYKERSRGARGHGGEWQWCIFEISANARSFEYESLRRARGTKSAKMTEIRPELTLLQS
jgi:hypothetical protein